MSEVWSIFVDKINKFNQKLIRYSALIIKSIISSSKNLSSSSIEKIEINKLKWELNKEKQKLGNYIFKCQSNDIYDFSNDPQFYKIIDKIKEIENFLKNKKIN